MSFNNMLKSLRLKKGLTQEELAKLTGLTRSAVGMYESGNREPKYEVLELLADFFNVDMNTLLDKASADENIPVFDDPDIRILARKSLVNDPQKAKKLRKMVKIILADDEDDD